MDEKIHGKARAIALLYANADREQRDQMQQKYEEQLKFAFKHIFQCCGMPNNDHTEWLDLCGKLWQDLRKRATSEPTKNNSNEELNEDLIVWLRNWDPDSPLYGMLTETK